MKLLTRPLEIDEQAIDDLYTRGVPESLVLDYKRELGDLTAKEAKHELLKDVTAMANAAGGLIVCGVDQDPSGAPSALPGLPIAQPDVLHNQIDAIVTTNLDPPVPGIVHRAVRRASGDYFYILRVPSSSQAPHMISGRTSRPRFYLRINTTNVPMNAAQIREVAQRHGVAEQRALSFVADRLAKNADQPQPWMCLNLVPLFREPYALDITDSEVTRRLVQLGLATGNPYHSVHGYAVEWLRSSGYERVLFSREGAVELLLAGDRWMLFDLQGEGTRTLPGKDVEETLLHAVNTVAGAEISGLPEPPVLLHLHLQGTDGSRIMGTNGFPSERQCDEPKIVPESTVLHDWGDDLDRAMRHAFDVIWQAYGIARSPYYDGSGNRRGN